MGAYLGRWQCVCAADGIADVLAGCRHGAPACGSPHLNADVHPTLPNSCCSKGIAADPSGTAVVRHRDLVAAGKEEFETAAGKQWWRCEQNAPVLQLGRLRCSVLMAASCSVLLRACTSSHCCTELRLAGLATGRGTADLPRPGLLLLPAGQAAKRQKTDKAKKQAPAFDPSQVLSHTGCWPDCSLPALQCQRCRPRLPWAGCLAGRCCCLLFCRCGNMQQHAAATPTALTASPHDSALMCLFSPQPFTLRSRQPWAEKEAVAVELTAEEKEYMEKVGFRVVTA